MIELTGQADDERPAIELAEPGKDLWVDGFLTVLDDIVGRVLDDMIAARAS